ncbi:Alpha/beta knot methyltransferase [Catenaria anguillulae PL171]|uniref:rRNA methyltransferase 1, mitochondrial n=1 Tax=Catenaria anguillulae PL171 TaxID=765915 RepID=A0A1Y2H9V1_9FUNG|nr:Alpha/beta knot methyltransferase [Catenaria anguillulae PL171]
MPNDYLYGANVVLAALLAQRRRLVRAHVQTRAPQLLGRRAPPMRPDMAAIMDLIQERNVPVRTRDRFELDELSDGRPHNGIVLEVSPLDIPYLKSLDRPSQSDSTWPPLWLYLDGIQDPQNLGAILRTSHFLGVSGVAIAERGSANPATPAVSKASAGALEMMRNVCLVSSGLTLVKEAKKDGWRILGAAKRPAVAGERAGGEGGSAHAKQTLVLIGNEHKGIRSSLLPLIDEYVWVRPSHAPTASLVHDPALAVVDEDPVESLNVSVATAIILSHLLGQRQSPVVHVE